MYFMLFKWRGIYFVNNVFSFCADSKSSETKTTWTFKQVYTPVSESKQNLNEFITWFSFSFFFFFIFLQVKWVSPLKIELKKTKLPTSALRFYSIMLASSTLKINKLIHIQCDKQKQFKGLFSSFFKFNFHYIDDINRILFFLAFKKPNRNIYIA